MTQNAALIAYLERYGSITRAECMSNLQVMEITPRLAELERIGFAFDRERESHWSKRSNRIVWITRYSIAKYPKAWKREQ